MASNIIQLGDYNWQPPPLPTSQDQVLFAKESKANQYWRRDNSFPEIFYKAHPYVKLYADKTRYDEDGIMLSLTEEDTNLVVRLFDRELTRRFQGVWMMINGELTYLPPGYYFMLQWGAMPDYQNPNADYRCPYGEYRKFQCVLHYFLQMCKEDKNCGGAYIGKAKKTGVTQLLSLDYLNEATLVMEKRLGMMSKNLEDNKRTNLMYFKYALNALPMIFKPTIAHENLTMIKFDTMKPKNSGSKNAAVKQMQMLNGFNTEVFAAPTIRLGFDGPKMFRTWLDEFPKYEDPYPEEVFDGNKEATKLGSKILGKMWISSYAPEKGGRAFEEGGKVWADSQDIDAATKRTLSGLYTHFISALDSGEEGFDIYGNCDRQKVKTWITANRRQRENNSTALQAFTRQYPETEEEMWDEGAVGKDHFDKVRIGKRKQELSEEIRVSLPFEYGNREWDGVPFKSTVTAVPLTDRQILSSQKGNWIFINRKYWNPGALNYPWRRVEGLPSYSNKTLKPDDHCPHAAAWDPTDYVGAADVEDGSKHAGMVEGIFDIAWNTYCGGMVTGQLFAFYHGRHLNPDDDFMEMAKCVWLFGCPIYVENNKPWMTTLIRKHGLEHFLIVRNSKNMLVPYNPRIHTKFPSTTRDVIDSYCAAIAKRIAEPKSPEDTDFLKYIVIMALLQQLGKFDPDKTKKYDVAVCYGLLRLLVESIMLTRQKKLEKTDANSMNSGMAPAMRYLINGF